MNLPISRRGRRAFCDRWAWGGRAGVRGARGVRRGADAHPGANRGAVLPGQLPLDTTTTFIIVNDSVTPAVGEITHLGGKILDAKGDPIRNALVEIWQVDGHGAYLHTKDPNRGKYNGNFQGFGRFLTGSSGEYYFRTIKPVKYPQRTPHIHFKVRKAGKELLRPNVT